jgi:toxin-antitoxin system PIN domain toxin
VIAVDTQLLVYALREDSPWHVEALAAVRALADGPSQWAIPWPCAHEFLAIATHPRIYRPPAPLALALQALRAWEKSPGLVWLGEGPGYLDRLEPLALAGRIAGPAVHDARVAALCLHHGVRALWSADRDFARFPGLRVVNPLARLS